MNVRELRKLISKLPDDLPVVVSGGPDHSYIPLQHVFDTEAGYDKSERTHCEWHGPEHASPGEVEVRICLLSKG